MTILLRLALSSQLVFAGAFGLSPDEAPAPEAKGERAAPPEESVKAFYRADKLFNEAKYEEALAAFQEADRLHPSPDLQYNIGLCHMQLGNWQDAILRFEIYLRTKKDPPDRADVEHRIQQAQAAMESEEVLAEAEAKRNAARAEPKGDEPDEPRDDLPAASKPHKGLVISGSVLLGLGVSGVIAGATGFGLVIQDKNDELDTIVNGGNPEEVSFMDASDTSDDAKRLRTAMWITVGASSAVAVLGASLLAVGLTRRSRKNRGGVAMSAWGGPFGGGLALRGRY